MRDEIWLHDPKYAGASSPTPLEAQKSHATNTQEQERTGLGDNSQHPGRLAECVIPLRPIASPSVGEALHGKVARVGYRAQAGIIHNEPMISRRGSRSSQVKGEGAIEGHITGARPRNSIVRLARGIDKKIELSGRVKKECTGGDVRVAGVGVIATQCCCARPRRFFDSSSAGDIS